MLKHKIWKILNESTDENSNRFLYHATYRPLLYSLIKHGIDPSKGKKNWPDSKKKYIYLATDPDVAISYAEESEKVKESWLDKIIVLKIDTNKIDTTKLSLDRNVRDNDGSTLEYKGIIPWDAVYSIMPQ